MNQSVDNYFIEGCGRCPKGGTLDCKVNLWVEELELLRGIVAESELTETSKWGVPCYTYNGNNVLVISALKSYCTVSFLKGVLLKNESGLLAALGKHSQASRILKFTDKTQVLESEKLIKACIHKAIEIEKAGLKVEFKKQQEPILAELSQKFKEDPMLKDAFEALSPGRQRGYLIYFSGAKQSMTRTSRIEKWIPKILNGEGMHDKYKRRK